MTIRCLLDNCFLILKNQIPLNPEMGFKDYTFDNLARQQGQTSRTVNNYI